MCKYKVLYILYIYKLIPTKNDGLEERRLQKMAFKCSVMIGIHVKFWRISVVQVTFFIM